MIVLKIPKSRIKNIPQFCAQVGRDNPEAKLSTGFGRLIITSNEPLKISWIALEQAKFTSSQARRYITSGRVIEANLYGLKVGESKAKLLAEIGQYERENKMLIAGTMEVK